MMLSNHLKQYRNSCHLRKAECKLGKNIGSAQKERCNPFKSSNAATFTSNSLTSSSFSSSAPCKGGVGNYTGCQLSRALSSSSASSPPPPPSPSCQVGERAERNSCLPCLCSDIGSLGPQCDQKGVCACRCYSGVLYGCLSLILILNEYLSLTRDDKSVCCRPHWYGRHCDRCKDELSGCR